MYLNSPEEAGARQIERIVGKASPVDVGERGQGAGQLLPGSFVIVHPIVPHLI
jgi:hypothetical protein